MLKDYLKASVVMGLAIGLIALIVFMTGYYAGTYHEGLNFALKVIAGAMCLPIFMALIQVGAIKLIAKLRACWKHRT